MTTNQVTVNGRMALARVPDAEDIRRVREGLALQAPDPYGKMAEIDSITGAGTDTRGHDFVCYHTKDGSGTISNSMKAGELMRTVALTNLLTSAQCDQLEAAMNDPKHFDAPHADYSGPSRRVVIATCLAGAHSGETAMHLTPDEEREYNRGMAMMAEWG